MLSLLLIVILVHSVVPQCFFEQDRCHRNPNLTYHLVTSKGGDHSIAIFKDEAFYFVLEPRSHVHYPRPEMCVKSALYQFSGTGTSGTINLAYNASSLLYQRPQNQSTRKWEATFFLGTHQHMLAGHSFPVTRLVNMSAGDRDNGPSGLNQTGQGRITEMLQLPAGSIPDHYIVYWMREGSTTIMVFTSTGVDNKGDTDKYGDSAWNVYGAGAFDYTIYGSRKVSYAVRTNGTVTHLLQYDRFMFNLDPRGSPQFDNQVLFGCPQNFCFMVTFDAVESTSSGIYITAGRFIWLLPQIGGTLSHGDAIELNKFLALDDTANVTFVHAMYHQGEDLVIVLDNEFFLLEREETLLHKIEGPPLPRQLENIDAAFTFDSGSIFIFEESTYYVLHPKTGDLNETYLGQFNMGGDVFPRPISDFQGLPPFIDAAFYNRNDSTAYFFYSSFMYSFKNWKELNGRSMTPQRSIIQNGFINCKNQEYRIDGVTTFNDNNSFIAYMGNLYPHGYNSTQVDRVYEVLTYLVYAVIGVICISVLLCFAVLFFYGWFEQPLYKPPKDRKFRVKQKVQVS